MGASRENSPSEDPTRPDPERRGPRSRGAQGSEVVGGYRLLEPLGAGGMGQVWRAQHEKHGKVAAVKLILRDFSGDAGGVTHEFRFLAEMQHPHIVSVFDTGMYEMPDGSEFPFVIMNIVNGAAPLTTYAVSRGLSTRERVELFLQACRAVEYVHKSGVVHLDIKPDNILVDGSGHVFLTDFGLARPVLGWFLEKSAGTPPYMSPEHLAKNIDHIDKPSDVWAMGAVLFRLITNEHAYDLPSDATRKERLGVVQTPARPLASAAPQLKRDAPDLLEPLEKIAHKALDPLPENRYEDGGELRTAVEAALEARPVVRAFTEFRRRRPHAWSALVMLAILLASSVLGVLITIPTVWLTRAPVNWLDAMWPAPRNSLARLARLPNVAIVGYDTQTAVDLAKTASIAGLDSTYRPSFRRMHAALIHLLAEADARVITLDLHFPSASRDAETDRLMADAITAARDAGIPVVAGMGATWPTKLRRPAMSAAIYEAEPLCAGLTVSSELTGLAVDLLVTRNGRDPMPGLALATYAACHSPGTYHHYRLDGADILITHFTAERKDDRVTTGTRRVSPTETVRQIKPDFEAGLEVDDRVSSLITTPPTEEALLRSAIDYADVFGMSPGERRAHFAGRVAFVHDHDDAKIKTTDIPAWHAHVTGIQAMLLGYETRLATWLNLPLIVLGATIGLGIGVASIRRRIARGIAGGARADPPAPPGRTTVVRRHVTTVLVATLASAAILIPLSLLTQHLFAVWLYPIPGIFASTAAVLLVLLPVSSRRPGIANP